MKTMLRAMLFLSCFGVGTSLAWGQNSQYSKDKDKESQKSKDKETLKNNKDMPKIRKVEGSPSAGLPYRLLMDDDASPEKPNRLIIWFHPSNGPGFEFVEPMAPEFIKRGYALLMVTKKDWVGWYLSEARKHLSGTVAAVGKIKGIKTQKPILMGLSGGGQMVLILWSDTPGAFGGIIVDAAYPLAPGQGAIGGQGQYVLLMPAKVAAVKQVPMYIVTGERDENSKWWKQAEPVYRKAGVPLTVRYVPGKGHQWLFGGEDESTDLYAWLEQINANKRP